MSETQQYSVKLFISPQEVRRFVFSSLSLEKLKEKIYSITNIPSTTIIELKYLDDEDDQVVLSTNDDLGYAISLSGAGRMLKVHLHVKQVAPWCQPHHHSGPNVNLKTSSEQIPGEPQRIYPMKKVKEFDARFIVHETYPDDAEVPAGTQFVKSWRVRNVGSMKWPEGSYFLQIDRANDLNAPERTPVASANPNEEVTVSVTMNSPKLAGRYQTYFKLCTPYGKKFGQRLRCQILSTSDSVICPDRIDRVWEQLEHMGFVSQGQRSKEMSSLIMKENCDISKIVRHLVRQ